MAGGTGYGWEKGLWMGAQDMAWCTGYGWVHRIFDFKFFS